MQRTVSTVLFALSLLPLGCSTDTAPTGPAGAVPAEGAVSGFRDDGDGEGDSDDDSDDGEGGDDSDDEDRDQDEGGGDVDDGDEDQGGGDEDEGGGDEDEGDDDDDSGGGGDEDEGGDDSDENDDGDDDEGDDDEDSGDDDEDSGDDDSEPSDSVDTDVAEPTTPTMPTTPTTNPGAAAGVKLPPANAAFDYQLGGDYPLPTGVKIVSRDRTGAAAAGAYNICYINGLQTQPDERSTWLSSHAELLLRKNGQVVSDPEWKDEMLLDISTADKRTALVALEAAWITECKSKGFSAIEVDNLDSYSRSGGLLTSAHAVAFMRLLSDRAHAAGLAIAQKNSAELATKKAELGTDFAVAEECAKFDECGAYTKAYGANVLIVEYTRAAFQKACTQQPQLSIVLRDLNLVKPGTSGYVREGC